MNNKIVMNSTPMGMSPRIAKWSNAISSTNIEIDKCGCSFARPGRGDCFHYLGLPGNSIPGQHDGPDDTVDVYGRPLGWCWSCWKNHQIGELETKIAQCEERITELLQKLCKKQYWEDEVLAAGLLQKHQLNASEAVYAFAAWLTTRDQPVIMSAKHDDFPVAEAIGLFCGKNNLPEVRDNYGERIMFPEEEKQLDENSVCTTTRSRSTQSSIGLDQNVLKSQKELKEQDIEAALACLSGDLSYDNIAEAKKILKTLISSPS